jgi:hypothetical protein
MQLQYYPRIKINSLIRVGIEKYPLLGYSAV